MKNLLQLFALVILGIAGTTACNNTPKKPDAKESAENKNDSKFENTPREDVAAFLVDAAEISLLEIELGKMMVTNGTLQDVKAMGNMMQSEHQAMYDEVKALAAKRNISIPAALSEKGKEHYRKLAEKRQGAEMDKAYCDMMIDGHKDAIHEFEKASGETDKDAEVSAWATNSLPALHKHLDHAKHCKDLLDKRS